MYEKSYLPTYFARSVTPLQRWCYETTRTRKGAAIKPRCRNGRQIAILAGLIALVAGSGCASMAPRANLAHIGYIAASAGDVVSTQRALSLGAVEANPLLGSNPSTPKLVAIKLAGWGGLRALEGLLERRAKRPLKWWEQAIVWAAPIGVTVWATANNNSVARRLE